MPFIYTDPPQPHPYPPRLQTPPWTTKKNLKLFPPSSWLSIASPLNQTPNCCKTILHMIHLHAWTWCWSLSIAQCQRAWIVAADAADAAHWRWPFAWNSFHHPLHIHETNHRMNRLLLCTYSLGYRVLKFKGFISSKLLWHKKRCLLVTHE